MATAQEMVEQQRARHRARYELSKLGGEGVRAGGEVGDPNPTSPGNKNAPMVAQAQAQAQSSPELEQALAFARAHPQPEACIEQGPAQLLDHGTPRVNAILSLPDAERDAALDEIQTKLLAHDKSGCLSILAPAREGVPQPINLQELGELVRALQGQVTAYSPEAREALAQLDAAFAPAAPEPVLTQPALPVGWDDPSMVWKGKVIKALGRNKWLFKPFKLSLRPEGALHVRNNILMKAGWTVWTQDNPYTDQGGYVLFGEYNRYGERMK